LQSSATERIGESETDCIDTRGRSISNHQFRYKCGMVCRKWSNYL